MLKLFFALSKKTAVIVAIFIALVTFFNSIASADEGASSVAILSAIDPAVIEDWKLFSSAEQFDEAWLLKRESLRRERLQAIAATTPLIVFTRHFDLGGSHYAYTEAQSDAQSERLFIPGSALCLLEIDSAGNTTVKTLLEDAEGVIRDPDVTFDGKKIVFSWKKSNLEDDYHLYDYEVATGKVRQLTFGLGFADYEPCVLPNGDIIFNSSRCVQIVDCWWTEVSNLYRCNSDGRYIRRLAFDQVHSNYPTLLEDGRVIYTRWDYNDRGQIFPQALFQMNPDGTAQTEFYGNNSWFPTTLLHSRGIPGSNKVVAVFSGHHNMQQGKLGIIDTTLGRQENSGTQLIAPIRETPAERIDAWGQYGDRFAHPLPLNESEFIVGYTPTGAKNTFGIYWIDEEGNRELLVPHTNLSCSQPVALAPRKDYPIRDYFPTDLNEKGVYAVQDIYFGPGLEGIERGDAKKLRVIALEFRSVGIGSNSNGGESGGALISTPIAIGNGTWDVKIPIGDALIEDDGSVAFYAPAKQPLYFQVLDKNNHVIATMRSWSTLQPGEKFACIGCHEDKNIAVPSRPSIAARKEPQELIPFYGPVRGFSFAKEIQPILDEHCISCHDNAEKLPSWIQLTNSERADQKSKNAAGFTPLPTAPGNRAYDPASDIGDSFAQNYLRKLQSPPKTNEAVNHPFSLLGEPVLDEGAKRFWSQSYMNLTGAARGSQTHGHANRMVNWLDIQGSPEMRSPYTAGAARSWLLRMFDPALALDGKTHNAIVLSQEELDKIAFWIDALVPYAGQYSEQVHWNETDWQRYHYYMGKKEAMQQLDRENNRKLLRVIHK